MRALLFSIAALASALPIAHAQEATDNDVLNARDLVAFTQRDPFVGARLSGMGGAAAGGVADWSAVYANPAAIGFLSRSQAVGALGTFRVENDVTDAFGTESDGVSRTTLGQLGYAAKLPTARGSLVIGGGYHEVGLYDRPFFFDNTQGYEEGQLGEVAVAAAIAVAPRTMAGISVNAAVGQYQLDRTAGTSYAATDLSLRGVNARLGFASEVAPGLRFGLALETPTLYDVDEEQEFGASDYDLYQYRITTPWRVTLGSAYQPLPDLLVAFDVALENGAEARFRPTGDFVPTNDLIRRELRETVEARLGAEARLGPVLARAGYAVAQGPRRDLRPEGVDGLRQHLTTGLGVQAGPLAQVNLAFVHTWFEDGALPGDPVEQVRRNRVVLGVQVRF